MKSLDTYEYRRQGRRPASYAALGFGMGLTYVNYLIDAPLLGWIAVSLLLAITLNRLALNHTAGLQIGRGRLEVYQGKDRRNFALARISGAELGRGSCLLHMSDGSRVALPHAALPPRERLAEELRACGVPVNFGNEGSEGRRAMRQQAALY
ncbi:hypothetical protein [Phaeovulum sp.]|uniref:hypothetical protein n=1 Tax=Phaeovulum sp. TaxID=2934796 RepID=UPI003563EBBB